MSSKSLEGLITEWRETKWCAYSDKDLAEFLAKNGVVVAKEIGKVKGVHYEPLCSMKNKKGEFIGIYGGMKIAIIEDEE